MTGVSANGTVAVVNEQGTTLTDLDGRSFFTTDTSLFWAIQGGGGGTWGVVISFTFKLHFAPKRFRNVVVNWALNYLGKLLVTFVVSFFVHCQTCVCTQAHTLVHARAHTNTSTKRHTHTHARMDTHTHARTHTRTHARTHAITHARTHTHAHTHTLISHPPNSHPIYTHTYTD